MLWPTDTLALYAHIWPTNLSEQESTLEILHHHHRGGRGVFAGHTGANLSIAVRSSRPMGAGISIFGSRMCRTTTPPQNRSKDSITSAMTPNRLRASEAP